jgi:pimeloyl-ACP methyl ester carboxylesterase
VSEPTNAGDTLPVGLPVGGRVSTNGIELVVHEGGEGPAIVLLHGFPELAYSWRYQIPALIAAGFRVIAPDQRGYGASDAPEDHRDYSMRTLVADVVGVLDSFDVSVATVVGHDFGGMVAWNCAVYASERVSGVVSLCTPHGPRGRTDIVESYRRRYGPTHYMTTFQVPGLAEAIFEADLDQTFRTMLRGVGISLAEFRALPEDVQALPMGLFVGDPQLFGRPLVSDDDRQVYVDAYRASGFRGPLSWYRSLPRTWAEAEGIDMTIDKPSLLIQAADDFFLAPDRPDLTDQYATLLERQVVADCGHWIQQEQPAEVNARLLRWLTTSLV